MERRDIEVVAAIIVEGEQLLATRRGYGRWKGWWEFPGGKIEPGETHQQALCREIREELDVEIGVGGKIVTIGYDYPDFHLTLHCYRCRIVSGCITLLEHESARWLLPAELPQLKWLPADLELIALLGSPMES